MDQRPPPLIRAFEAWLASEQGKRLQEGGCAGHYLRNRLAEAFEAGAGWRKIFNKLEPRPKRVRKPLDIK